MGGFPASKPGTERTVKELALWHQMSLLGVSSASDVSVSVSKRLSGLTTVSKRPSAQSPKSLCIQGR